MSTSTFMARPETITRQWFLIDATDQVVGRLAVQIANILRGKHRPQFTPHVDTGEFVVVINAEKIRLTGKKLDTKTYHWYTRYPGGLKEARARDWIEKHPERILTEAVRRMISRNRLGRQQMTKLKVYRGPQHPHQAQQPIEVPRDWLDKDPLRALLEAVRTAEQRKQASKQPTRAPGAPAPAPAGTESPTQS